MRQVKGTGTRVSAALFALMVAVVAFATTPSNPVDPSPIATAVQGQMTAIITAGVGLLVFGIVAGVGWRYAKRFLKG